MISAKVTQEGQLKLPRTLLGHLGITAGGQVELVETADGVLIRAKVGDIRALKGIIPKPARPVSVAAMNRSLAKMGRPR